MLLQKLKRKKKKKGERKRVCGGAGREQIEKLHDAPTCIVKDMKFVHLTEIKQIIQKMKIKKKN